jgi:UDP-N-acetyl-D-mannosaminuronate dehydrogenase
LGYVGLPLARLFATNTLWLGMINQTRVAAQSGSDSTFEVDEVTLQVLVSAQLMPQVCIAPLM